VISITPKAANSARPSDFEPLPSPPPRPRIWTRCTAVANHSFVWFQTRPTRTTQPSWCYHWEPRTGPTNRLAGPHAFLQGLKPASFLAFYGAAEKPRPFKTIYETRSEHW